MKQRGLNSECCFQTKLGAASCSARSDSLVVFRCRSGFSTRPPGVAHRRPPV